MVQKPKMVSRPTTSGIQPPAVGLPPNTKDTGRRVDFREDDFKLLIETKGTRLGWARAAPCPCLPINSQTQQPDPNCSLCQETPGWTYFAPEDYAVPTAAGEIDRIQRASLDRYAGAVIRGVVTGANRKAEPFNNMGDWAFGAFMLTVRAENRMSYMDRLVFLDSTTAWAELVETDATGLLKLRYPARFVNLLGQIVGSELRRFRDGRDFFITDAGHLQFCTDPLPPTGSRYTVHYLHHPVALVMEHAKAWRDSLRDFKNPSPTTPLGDPQELPQLVSCKLEYTLLRT